MIALGETLSYAAEVAFTLPLSGDPETGLTGWTFSSGEVQIKLPVGGWTDVASQVVEKGYGRFCVRLNAGQTVNAGDVFVKAVVSGTQFYFGSDVIGRLGGDIGVSSTGSVPFFLPLETDPVNGAPLTGHTFASGEVRVCLPNGVYTDADPSQIDEIGFGGYRLRLTAGQTANRGKVFVYAKVTGYQRWEGYCTILNAQTGDSTTPVVPDPIPVPVPIVFGDPEYVNQYAIALNRLPQQFRSGSLLYGQVNTPAPALSTLIGTYTPAVITYEVKIPTVADSTVSNHLALGLHRLPQQFRSGTLSYDLPIDTTPQQVAGVYVPPAIPYDIVLPVIVDTATSSHLVSALGRLPQQFRSGTLFYGGLTLDGILGGP